VNGAAVPDSEGVSLPSVAAARKEAMTAAAEMAKNGGGCPKEIMIVVRDGAASEPITTVRLSLACD
jgi:hypothetical protein